MSEYTEDNDLLVHEDSAKANAYEVLSKVFFDAQKTYEFTNMTLKEKSVFLKDLVEEII